jgi:hypothetical protein
MPHPTACRHVTPGSPSTAVWWPVLRLPLPSPPLIPMDRSWTKPPSFLSNSATRARVATIGLLLGAEGLEDSGGNGGGDGGGGSRLRRRSRGLEVGVDGDWRSAPGLSSPPGLVVSADTDVSSQVLDGYEAGAGDSGAGQAGKDAAGQGNGGAGGASGTPAHGPWEAHVDPARCVAALLVHPASLRP